MDDSKVFMFPDGAKGSIDPNLLLALQNNGGFGGGMGFYWIFFLWMMWSQNGRNGNFQDYVAQMNNQGQQYLAEIMNDRRSKNIMTYKEEAYLLNITSENNEMLHQIIGVLSNLIVKHNQENDEDFTRNVIANLVSESFSRYKK